MFLQPSIMDSPFIINDNPAKLQHLCRMCATPCIKSVPIFGPVGEENELAIKFNSYLPLKVSETDSIPLQLCYECSNLLMQWDAAILVAIAADKKLRALLWREQQSQQFSNKDKDNDKDNDKDKEETERPEPQRKRKRSAARVHESLCCSVCNLSGLDFRQLVEHLKTHEGAGEETETSSSRCKSATQNSASIDGEESSDVDCLINDLLTPVVCLEPLGLEREPCSKKGTSGSSPEKSNTPSKNKKGKRGRPKKVNKSFHTYVKELYDVADDPIVTSSTSTPHNKPSETSEADNTQSSPLSTAHNYAKPSSNAVATTVCNDKKEVTSDSQNNTFKPKVRIISAESINQTLEERAKANQTARNSEAHQPKVFITRSSPPSGGLSPPSGGLSPSSGGLSSKLPTKPQVRRLVLSGQVVKGINLDAAKPGQKFLKLSDGRIIKIIQGTPNSQSTSTVSFAQSGQKMQVLSSKVIGSDSEKPAFQLRPVSPDALKITESHGGPLVEAQPSLVRQMRQVGNKHFYFSCQPGPKHSANRFICEFCGKRNLTLESLQEHSQLHVP